MPSGKAWCEGMCSCVKVQVRVDGGLPSSAVVLCTSWKYTIRARRVYAVSMGGQRGRTGVPLLGSWLM